MKTSTLMMGVLLLTAIGCKDKETVEVIKFVEKKEEYYQNSPAKPGVVQKPRTP